MTRKILFVSPVPPWPADSGGAQRSFLLYQALKRLGQVDTVLITANEIADEALREMRARFGLKAVLRPHPGGLTLRRLDLGYGPVGVNVLRLTRWLLRSRFTLYRSGRVADEVARLVRDEGYDLAVGRYLWSVVQTGVIDLLPTWLDFDDLESEVWHSRAEEAGPRPLKAYYRQIAGSYAARERQLAARLAGGWVAKARDAERLGRDGLAVLPNIPFANYPAPAAPLAYTGGDALNVLGVAAFDYRPNLLGFDWFVTQVWSRIALRFPRARLHLVGKLTDEDARARWTRVPGVVVHGRVPELAPFYEQALFTVAPIFQGGGTNIKVIEALVYGRCCVGTTHALKGFEGLDGLREGADAQAWLERCVELLQAPAECVAAGLAAAPGAAARFSFGGFSDAVRQALGPENGNPSVAAVASPGGAGAPQASGIR
ncbi:glycosyltransferase family 4 protein [Mitsuaria sp. GD03876]|uniref:glycosyltransferase n=1 Tax=Mitsuaria sp. GD03876 TaxID=2975399 RepID=UPI0024482E71|nr:glycosyltransferase family 4 protein [Mitsuaria sp. GD03876]MDH0868293.1 glycosyltransferase family 4 protein [Mitsuaria sp. GD03876]